MDPDYEYDVAFSFLADDEPLAARFTQEFAGRLRTFMYSERQKELVGKDGLEAFTSVFRDQSRVCVILHRTGWANTKWTRVEETAIKDRAFEKGWDFLIVIALDQAPPPPWLPRTKIWFGFERFGFPAAVGVIDARVQELGGEVKVEMAKDRSIRLARDADRAAERIRLLSSAEGVMMANEEVAKLFNYLENHAGAIATHLPQLETRFVRRDANVAGVTSRYRSTTFGWTQQYSNTLQHSSLFVRDFDGRYSFDGYAGGPNVVREVHVTFTLDDAGVPSWREDDNPDRLYSTGELAERYLHRLLEASVKQQRNSQRLARLPAQVTTPNMHFSRRGAARRLPRRFRTGSRWTWARTPLRRPGGRLRGVVKRSPLDDMLRSTGYVVPPRELRTASRYRHPRSPLTSLLTGQSRVGRR